MARAQGATDLLIAGDDTVAQILEMTGGFGADYTFEATGLVAVMRQAVESRAHGLGPVHARRRRRQGRDARRDPPLPDHRPAHRRHVLRRRQGPRPRPRARAPVPRGRARSRRVRLAPDAARRRQPRLRADGAPGRRALRAHLQPHDLRTLHGRRLALEQLRRRRPPRRPRDPDRCRRPARADQRGDRALPAAPDARAADAPPRGPRRAPRRVPAPLRGAGARARARGRRDRRRRHDRSATATSSRAATCAST